MTGLTQIQMFYLEQRRVADATEAFLFLVANGLTRQDLATNIARRPSLWGRYANWLPVLPTAEEL